MKEDHVFRGSPGRGSDFVFDAEVAQAFDDMLLRSVPFYEEQQSMITEIARKFWLEGTQVYDLGCSTATTLINLASAIGETGRLIGYDNSPPMLEEARLKIGRQGLADQIELRPGDLNGDLSVLPLENASVVTMCWTLQFIRPMRRDEVIRWIHHGLVDNGVFVVTEKTLTNSSPMNRTFIDLYYDFKRRNGYVENEILRKREALENVLIPYRIDENVEMFRRNGFEIVETFFQWFNFTGFLCVKRRRRE